MKNFFITIFILCILSFVSCDSSHKGKFSEKTEIWHVDTTFVADSSKSASFTMQFSMEFPEFSSDFTQDMALSILKQATGIDSISTPKSIMKSYKDHWVAYYDTTFKEVCADPDSSFSDPNFLDWYYSVKGDIFGRKNDILCYKISTESKFGEIIQSESYINITKNNTILGLEDYFNEGYEDILSEMIVQRLTKDFNLKSEKALESIGFFDISDISPSQNFAIDENGVTFVYNRGLISANVLGIISVFIPFSDLDNTLIKE